METYRCSMKAGISRSNEFEKKGLAQFAANTGLKCGHGCTYCSTGAMLRTNSIFANVGVSPFDNSYAIVDPDTPARVARDARQKRKRGLIQLCTIVDAWSAESQEYNLGRRCLEAILAEPGWSVRILTKNAAVQKDFDIVEKYRDRILVGMSITAPSEKAHLIQAIEPHASPIEDRVAVMLEAHARKFRTFAMFCPLLPGIADESADIDEFIQFAERIEAEDIFSEAVNRRGRGLILTQEALSKAGYHKEAKAVEAIRMEKAWSAYVARLIGNVQQSVHQYSRISKLRFLLYPSGLASDDLRQIQDDDDGVVWLT